MQLQTTEGFDWCCVTTPPDAPGLSLSYGTLGSGTDQQVSFSGVADTVLQSLRSAAGEACEFAALFNNKSAASASQAAGLEAGLKPLKSGWLDALHAQRHDQHLVIAEHFCDQQPRLLPAALCFAAPYFNTKLDRQISLSSGMGCGISRGKAAAHGLFEIIEHDAVVGWWISGQKARFFEPGEINQSSRYLQLMRQGNPGRRETHLLQLQSATEFPVAAAVSFDQHGQCFACGTACRPDIIAAANSAIREMCQMEFGHHAVRAKIQQHGINSLSVNDHAQLHRAQLITRDLFLPLINTVKTGAISLRKNPGATPQSEATSDKQLNSIASKVDAYVVRYPDRSGRATVCKVVSPRLRPLVKSEDSSAYNSNASSPDSPSRLFEGVMP